MHACVQRLTYINSPPLSAPFLLTHVSVHVCVGGCVFKPPFLHAFLYASTSADGFGSGHDAQNSNFTGRLGGARSSTYV